MPFSANVPVCGCIQSYRGTRRYLEVILIRSIDFWKTNIPRLLGLMLLIAAIAAAIIAGVMLLTDDNTAEPLVTTNTTAATTPATSGTLPPATGLVTTEAASDTTTDATSDPTAEPTTEPTSDVTTEPTSDPATDTTSDTASDTTTEPTSTEPTSETSSDVTSDTTADTTSDMTSESTSDTTIEYSETQSNVEITVDGETMTISTNAANVSTVLYEAGIHLGPIDEVSPDRSSAVYDGLRIRVVRVEIMRYPIEVEIDFETERVETDDLYVGTEEVATEGVLGIKRVIYEQTLRDGMLWQNDVVSSEITQEPVTKVVRVGIKPVPTTEATTTTTTVTTTTRATTTTTTTRATTRATTPATTTRATTRATTTPATTTKPPTTATTPPPTTATTPPPTTATTPPTTETTPPTTSETTATTETSPTTEQTTTQSEPEQLTVTIDGKVYKVKKVIQGEAVSYYSNNPHPLTYSGNPAIPGKTVAVDRSVIPLGSMLYVTALDGTAWTYGPAYAHDIGGGIKGNIVDLFRESYDACVAHGRRKCYIYIIEP